jgi:hypothetical protein
VGVDAAAPLGRVGAGVLLPVAASGTIFARATSANGEVWARARSSNAARFSIRQHDHKRGATRDHKPLAARSRHGGSALPRAETGRLHGRDSRRNRERASGRAPRRVAPGEAVVVHGGRTIVRLLEQSCYVLTQRCRFRRAVHTRPTSTDVALIRTVAETPSASDHRWANVVRAGSSSGVTRAASRTVKLITDATLGTRSGPDFRGIMVTRVASLINFAVGDAGGGAPTDFRRRPPAAASVVGEVHRGEARRTVGLDGAENEVPVGVDHGPDHRLQRGDVIQLLMGRYGLRVVPSAGAPQVHTIHSACPASEGDLRRSTLEFGSAFPHRYIDSGSGIYAAVSSLSVGLPR